VAREKLVRNWWKFGVVAVVTAAVAVPATVIAGDGGNTDGDTVARQTTTWSGKETTNTKQWKEVPGLPVFFPPATPGLESLTVSAQMTSGAAKFRVLRPSDNAVTPPGAVRFNSKAANSFTFSIRDSCGQGEGRELQWKKAGKHRAVAAKISTLTIWDAQCF
jgi:hypothetical protein